MACRQQSLSCSQCDSPSGGQFDNTHELLAELGLPPEAKLDRRRQFLSLAAAAKEIDGADQLGSAAARVRQEPACVLSNWPPWGEIALESRQTLLPAGPWAT